MKVLVTGSGGQVGRALLESVPAGLEAHGLSHADLDIADAQAVAAALERFRPDALINAAAYTPVDRAEEEPELARRINAEGAAHLARAARQVGARLVHLSTDFVFDGTQSSPYAIGAATAPLGVYGRTKREGELAVLEQAGEALVLRTAWVYAPWGANFVRTMLRLMRASGAVRVVADQVGTPTSALGLAELVWGVVQRPEIRGVHHWTDAGVASWYDFAVAIAEDGAAAGLVPEPAQVHPVATAEYPTRARRPAYSVLEKRSLQALGFAPLHWRVRLREVLARLAADEHPAGPGKQPS